MKTTAFERQPYIKSMISYTTDYSTISTTLSSPGCDRLSRKSEMAITPLKAPTPSEAQKLKDRHILPESGAQQPVRFLLSPHHLLALRRELLLVSLVLVQRVTTVMAFSLENVG